MTNTIDISKLTRRPVNLGTVTKPRFLFPGWQGHSYASWNAARLAQHKPAPIDELGWNKLPATAKFILLPRRGAYQLRIEFDNMDEYHAKEWCLVGPGIVVSPRASIWQSPQVDFETLVRAAETALLHAHESYDYRVLSIGGPGPRERYQVDLMMKVWRNPDFTEQERV